jgi:glutaredoxin 3
VERTGMFTFPQIVIGDEPIGGFDQLLAADRAGRLAELLAA